MGEKNEEEREEAPIYLNNVQETLFEIAINESEERKNRIKNRNDELLQLCEQVRNNINSTDIETTDQIAQLNRELFVEITKVNNSRKAIDIIEQERRERKAEHESLLKSLQEKYDDTQLKLLSKMKTLNAKINGLEDFKIKKSMLESKLSHCDELMEHKELQLKERLFQIDIKFKIDREKLIENLHKKLFELSALWASDNEKRKSPIVRRLFQENIAIQYELDQNALQMENKKHHYSNTNPLDLDPNRGLQYRKNTIKSLKITKTQRKLIRLLKENLRQQRKHLEGCNSPMENPLIDYDRLIDKLQTNISRIELDVASLKHNFHIQNDKLKHMTFLRNQLNKKIDKYFITLYDIKYAVACALQVICCGSDIASMSKTQLTSYLEDLVMNIKPQ